MIMTHLPSALLAVFGLSSKTTYANTSPNTLIQTYKDSTPVRSVWVVSHHDYELQTAMDDLELVHYSDHNEARSFVAKHYHYIYPDSSIEDQCGYGGSLEGPDDHWQHVRQYEVVYGQSIISSNHNLEKNNASPPSSTCARLKNHKSKYTPYDNYHHQKCTCLLTNDCSSLELEDGMSPLVLDVIEEVALDDAKAYYRTKGEVVSDVDEVSVSSTTGLCNKLKLKPRHVEMAARIEENDGKHRLKDKEKCFSSGLAMGMHIYVPIPTVSVCKDSWAMAARVMLLVLVLFVGSFYQLNVKANYQYTYTTTTKRKYKYGRCQVRAILSLLMMLSIAGGSSVLAIDSTANVNTKATNEEVGKPQDSFFGFVELFQSLTTKQSQLLRGGDGTPEEAEDFVSDVQQMLTLYLNMVDQLEKSKNNGGELEELMNALLGDVSKLQLAQKEASDVPLEFTLPESLSLDHPIDIDLRSMPASTLAEAFDTIVQDDTVEHVRSIIPVLGNAVSSLREVKKHRRLEKEENDATGDFKFEYARAGGAGTGNGSNSNSNPFKDFGFGSDFGSILNKSGLQRMKVQLVKSAMHKQGIRLSSHLKKNSNFEGGDAYEQRGKERHRRLQDDEDCQVMCPDISNDSDSNSIDECSCNRLRDCVNDLTDYDFAVLFALGYINEDGEFTVADQLNLFDAGDKLPSKIARIRELLTSVDSQDCPKLLKEFYTLCPPGQSCISANTQSYQLSVDDVCDAVNTPVKLLVEQVATTFDSFPTLAGGPFVEDDFQQDIIEWYTSQVVDLTGCSLEMLDLDWWQIYYLSDDGPTLACRYHMQKKLEEYEAEWIQSTNKDTGQDTDSQCESVSYNVCGNFASAFDHLYNAVEEINPMRYNVVEEIITDDTQPIHPDSGVDALRLSRFPIEYTFNTSIHGIKKFDDEYIYADFDGFPFPGDVSQSRGSWTLVQEKNWVRCSTNSCSSDDELVDSTSVRHVKCCSDHRVDPFIVTQICESNAWHGPVFSDSSQCPGKLTHEEAVEYCRRKGGRLCTSDELRDSCAGNNGCNIQNELIWAAYSFDFGPSHTGCLGSQNSLVRSTRAMETCDESIALLVGQDTSVGTVERLANIVNDPNIQNASERMPGKCCLDTALNSEHFGYDYNPDKMECQYPGPYHLGISPEACENANGRWTRSPCYTLQECIANRPSVSPGYCTEDETIQCRDDSLCPLIYGSGTCSNTDDIVCTLNGNECTSEGSVCVNISDDVQTKCVYDPGYFEEWVLSFTIDNVTDVAQCEFAREELGFDPEELDDVFICEEFKAFKCDPDSIFDILDAVSIPPKPRTTTSVKYTDVSYPEDAALSYEELPTDPGWEGASIIVGTGEEQRLLNLESSRYYVGRAKSFWADLKEHQKDILQGICANIPRVIGVPVIGIVPNPFYYICLAIKTLKSTVLWIVYIGLVAAYDILDIQYTGATLSESKVIDAAVYSKMTYKNLEKYTEWNIQAFGVQTNNMINQHTQMRGELQTRHVEMLNRINKFTNCRTELHGIDMTRDPDTDLSAKNILLRENPECECILYNKCSDDRRLEENDEEGNNTNTTLADEIENITIATLEDSFPNRKTSVKRMQDYNTCITIQQLMTIAQLIYPDASILGGLTDECRETLEKLNDSNNRRRLEGDEDPVSGLLDLLIEFPDGSTIDASGIGNTTDESVVTPSGQGRESQQADESSGLNDITSTVAGQGWYVNWYEFTCVQDCEKDEGLRCGGKRKHWAVLHSTLEECCDFHLKWKSEECNRHEGGSRRLTDNKEEEDLIDAKTNWEGLDIIKAMGSRLEDVSMASKAMEGKLAWVESNVDGMKANDNDMKDDMEEVKNDVKDIKALLAELVGRNKGKMREKNRLI